MSYYNRDGKAWTGSGNISARKGLNGEMLRGLEIMKALARAEANEFQQEDGVVSLKIAMPAHDPKAVGELLEKAARKLGFDQINFTPEQEGNRRYLLITADEASSATKFGEDALVTLGVQQGSGKGGR